MIGTKTFNCCFFPQAFDIKQKPTIRKMKYFLSDSTLQIGCGFIIIFSFIFYYVGVR